MSVLLEKLSVAMSISQSVQAQTMLVYFRLLQFLVHGVLFVLQELHSGLELGLNSVLLLF